MAQNQSPRWILDPEIESSYEAIGRAVVETAMAEAKQAKNMGEHEYEATVTLRFTVVIDQPEVIEGVGEVVRIETDPPGMGVVFKKLSKYSAKLIELLLAKG